MTLKLKKNGSNVWDIFYYSQQKCFLKEISPNNFSINLTPGLATQAQKNGKAEAGLKV